MSAVPALSPVESIIKRPAVEERVRKFLAEIPKGGTIGGITIGSKSASRVLVYWGSCPDHIDKELREILDTLGYQVSLIRDPKQSERYTTL